MTRTAASEARRREREVEASRKKLRERTAKGARRINIIRPAKSAITRFNSGRASRSQCSFIKRGVVQTLNYKKFSGSLVGDKYAEKKAIASFSNMLGQNSKERIEEFDLDIKRHSGVLPKNLIVHIALSLPSGQKRSAIEWRQAVQLFMKKIDAQGCNYTAHIHDDSDNQHVHIIYSRARPDGKLVDQSWNYIRHREAAAQVADELFGGRETPRPSNTPPAPPSDRAEAARRRAKRRGTVPAHIYPAIVRAAISSASTPGELAQALQARQVEICVSTHADGTARGLLLRRQGAQEWLAASSISREFSLPRVQARLAENAASASAAAQRHQARAYQARSEALRQSPTYSRQRGG